MPAINITKGASANTMRRGDLQPGMVFALVLKDGKLGKNWGHVGVNSSTGRMYSVNLETGELASAGPDKADREVVLTGAFKYVVNNHPTPSVERDCKRSEVQSGEVFHVNDKEVLYAHLGAIHMDVEGWLSVPMSRTENHAVTKNGNSNVHVVGTFTIDVETTN